MIQRAALWGVATLGLFLAGCGSDSLQHLEDPRSGPDSAWPDQDLGAVSVDQQFETASVDDDAESVGDADGGVVQTGADTVSLDGDLAAGAEDQEEGEVANAEGDGDPPAPTRVIVKFRPGSTASERAALHRKNGLSVDRTIPQLQIHAVKIPPNKTAEDVVARYDRHPLVEFAEVDPVCEPASVPDDPLYSRQWHLPAIGAPQAWEATTGNAEVMIAILDTGVNGSHSDLSEKMVPGWNVYDDNNDTSGVSWHGTWVAGAAAAASNNGNVVASVAWDCRIMPVRVSDDRGIASGSAIAAGLVWAADHGARVANVSYGGASLYQSVATAASYFQSRAGGVVIDAAGNSGAFIAVSDNPYVTTVSATEQGDVVAEWSNTGTHVNISAPGSDILTTGRNDSYVRAAGTSVAAPIVAGVAALAASANPLLTGVELQRVLEQSADDFGPRGWDPEYGWGRVNAARAVQMALDYHSTPDETPPTVAIVDPVSGAVLSGLSVVVATASDDTSVSQVDLYDNDVLVSSDTVPPHQWTIDTTAMPDGVHFLRAIAHDAAGNVGISAPVQVTVDNSVPCECPPDCSEPAANETPGVSCTDGLDNDCDGAVDCDDPDCDSDAACFVPGCGNGACEADENMCSCPQDCGSAPSAEISCENGVDDDCDGGVDCADSDCASDAACNVEPCGDGACDSASGEDGCTCPEDCGSPPSTERKCTDGMDDDCDGLADGDDPDCIVTSGCGNGVCEGDGEDCFTCPEDCGCRGTGCKACCGNGSCKGPGENKNTCPVDCAK